MTKTPKLAIGEFQPHSEDAYAVEALSNVRVRYRLDPKGRIWSVYAQPTFEDSHVPWLYGLNNLIEFNIGRPQFVKSRTCLTADGVCRILQHPSLKAILIDNICSLTDEVMSIVASTKRLRWMLLPNNGVTDERVELLEQADQLLSLSLRGNPITDSSVATLCKLTNLRRLWVNDTEISGEGIARLTSSLRRCELNRVDQRHPRDISKQ